MAGLIAAKPLVAPGTFGSLTLVDIIPKSNPAGVAKIMGFMAPTSIKASIAWTPPPTPSPAYLPHRPRPTDLAGTG